MTEKAKLILQYLNEGKTYIQIQQLTGASPVTIAKVKRNFANILVKNEKLETISVVSELQSPIIQKENSPAVEFNPNQLHTVVQNHTIILELQKIKGEKEKLSIEKEKLQAENLALAGSEKKKDTLIQNLKIQISTTKNNFQIKNKQANSEISHLKKQMEKCKTESSFYKNQSDKYYVERSKLLKQIDILQSANNELEQQLKKFKNQYDELRLNTAIEKAKYLKEKIKNY